MNNTILPSILSILSIIAAAGLVSCVAPPPTTYSGGKGGIPSSVPAGSGQAHDWGPFGTGERDRVLLVPYGDPHRRGVPGDDRDRLLLHEDSRRSGGTAEVLRRAE